MWYVKLGLWRRLDGQHSLVFKPCHGPEVLVGDVSVRLVLVEQLQLQLRVLDEVVELLFLGCQVGQVCVQVGMLSREIVVLRAAPND